MEKTNSYVYFALTGDDFDPKEITEILNLSPSYSWKKGEKGKYKKALDFAGWELSTDREKEDLFVDNLVDEFISKLTNKITALNEIKRRLQLTSKLVIVLFVDTNEDNSTPALGHDLKTIEFLYQTNTTTDIDIYRYNSDNKVI